MNQATPRALLLLLLCLLAWPGGAAELKWGTRAGLRTAAVQVPRTGKTGFTLLGEVQTGIGFTNQLADASAAENQIRQNGSGVALGDVDGDGRCDIYLCR